MAVARGGFQEMADGVGGRLTRWVRSGRHGPADLHEERAQPRRGDGHHHRWFAPVIAEGMLGATRHVEHIAWRQAFPAKSILRLRQAFDLAGDDQKRFRVRMAVERGSRFRMGLCRA